MRLRLWVLCLLDALVILHILFLTISLIDSKYLNWMFSTYSPKEVYIVVNVLFLAGAGVLYYGVLYFNANYVLGWIAFMILLWQIPFILLIVNIIFIQIKESPGYFQLNVFMLPSFWLGAWSLILIKTGKFWHELKQFNKEPHFVRSNSILMRKVIDYRKRVSTIPNIRTRYQNIITSL